MTSHLDPESLEMWTHLAEISEISFKFYLLKSHRLHYFQLLGFVVQAGQRFAAITEMDIGNDSQNRAVGTTIALLETWFASNECNTQAMLLRNEEGIQTFS
jgi:hypothetical protein